MSQLRVWLGVCAQESSHAGVLFLARAEQMYLFRSARVLASSFVQQGFQFEATRGSSAIQNKHVVSVQFFADLLGGLSMFADMFGAFRGGG